MWYFSKQHMSLKYKLAELLGNKCILFAYKLNKQKVSKYSAFKEFTRKCIKTGVINQYLSLEKDN